MEQLLKPNTNDRAYQIRNIFNTSFKEKWNTAKFSQELEKFTLENDNDLAIPFIEGIADPRLNLLERQYAFELLPYFSKSELLIKCSKHFSFPLDYLDSLIVGKTDWEELQNYVHPQHLKHILSENGIYAEIPEWMKTEKQNRDKSDYDFDTESVLNQLKEKLDVYSEDGADVYEEDVANVAKAVMEMVPKDIDKAQIYGPVNGCKKCIDEKDCHMFTCKCSEEEDNEFNKKCNGCGIGIKNIRYCLRFPREDHGWSGWYHSYECLLDNTPEPSLAEVAKLKLLKSFIDNYGILRIYKTKK